MSVRSDRSLLSSGGLTTSGGSSGLISSSKKTAIVASEDVDQAPLRPAIAFQTFAGALYGGAAAFESGRSASAASYESAKFESPFARLQRLQGELTEFANDLRAAAASVPSEAAGIDSAWGTLGTSVAQLQGQLDSVIAQPQIQGILTTAESTNIPSADPSSSSSSSSSLLPHFDTLFSDYVRALQQDPSFTPLPSTTQPTAPASGTLPSELAALPKLEDRLAVLEKFIGISSGTGGGVGTAAANNANVKPGNILSFGVSSSSSASSSTASSSSVSVLPAPDLLTSLSSLHTQLASLNPQRLEFVQRAIKAVIIEQEAMTLAKTTASEKKEASESASSGASSGASAPAHAAQVSTLYSLTARWDSLALALPSLINRLTSLHTLHASSATLASRVVALERSSDEIDAAIRSQKDGIKEVQAAATENMKQIQDNFKAMEKRIEQIAQKMAQIKTK